MSLVFRSGTDGDAAAVARLASHSFPAAGRSHSDWESWLRDSSLGGLETLFVGADGGEVLAACRLYPYEQWIGGAALPVMGLGLVTIGATARRRGLAGRMCTAAFEEARSRGAAASALYPFRTSFYANLGYGMAGDVLQYRVAPGDLPDHEGRAKVSLVESDGDRRAVASVYDRWAPRQTGQMVRGARKWETVWQDGTRYGALYRDDDGPAGYAVFRYIADAARGARAVDVEEIVWLHREARLGLYGWLASLADQWDIVNYRAHPEEAFAEHLRELQYRSDGVPRWHFWFDTATVLSGPMFRLLDFDRAWSSRSIRDTAPMTVALEVQDTHVPANSGEWSLRLADGRAHVARGAASPADVRMAVGIQALSRIFIGALTPSAAVLGGLATVDRPERLPALDDLLRVPKPWTFDRF